MADATATITGFTTEPELRFTQGGMGICTFSVAVRRAFKKNDEWEEVVTWWKVQVWGEYGENCAATLHKGTRVTCTGYPEIEEWEDREGSRRQTLVLRADDVAVNLKWARAEVAKVERQAAGGASTQSTGQGGRQAQQREDPVYGETEPF